MKTTALICAAVVLSASVVFAHSEIPRYHQYFDYLMASPGSMAYGLYGYVNPAVVRQAQDFDALFAWSGTSKESDDLDRWGLFTALPVRMGFGVIHTKEDPGTVNDYRVALAVGSRASSFGVGYGWSGGSTHAYGRGKVLTVGTLSRPNPYLSLGLSGTFATSGPAKEGLFDIGIRPLGREIVTVFGDYAPQKTDRFEDAPWSTGLVLEPLSGVRVGGRYFSNHQVSLGLNLSLGRIGLQSQAHSDEDRKRNYNTYSVRMGALDRTFLRPLVERNSKYLEIDLKGPVKYQRYKWFDKSNTLLGLVSAIDAAREDETIAGIAVNMSGMQIPREMAWEIREGLRKFRAAGKKVVVYADDAGMTHYQFASVADRIVLDPISDVSLIGIRAGRVYYKGSLEKVGIGFDELRFFKFKTAYETFSRDDLSEGDQEQIQALTNDWYHLARTEVCDGRNIDPAEFDSIVNDSLMILPGTAVKMGLADTLGRWDAVKDVIREIEGGKAKVLVGAGDLARYALPDATWGPQPKIALIYGIGVCAMDEGIKARNLEKIFDSVTGRRDIKAVVFRVDSPGGSALASDVVAEAMKRCRKKKPLIVSQGAVAGSGGYWISMYADTIVAAPLTITGSIGVIGGWFYNVSLKEKLGMSTGLVKVGDHADLGFGITLPFVGQLPNRDLTEGERADFKSNILYYYDLFVKKVASGRRMEAQDVYKIAQGRIWSGTQGMYVGLVDVLGGLETAITIARTRAGIPAEAEVEIVQFPEPELLSPSIFAPSLFGVSRDHDTLLDHLRFRLEHNGEPMPLLPLDEMGPYLEAVPVCMDR
jgi:protease-4